MKDKIEELVASMVAAHVGPRIEQAVESLVLQETNKWGEANKPPMTCREFLLARAENYLTEKVSYEGKSKEESQVYSWSPSQTRITHMIDRHLHYNSEAALKGALATFNKELSGGLTETVRMKFEELAGNMKISVGLGRS